MKKSITTLLLIGMVCHLQAQLLVNGHIAPFDTETKTWLATIPESQFGMDNLLTVGTEDMSSDIVINNSMVKGSYLFRYITSNAKYVTYIRDAEGKITSGTIQFTFLPLIQLKGEFGYDYQEGTVAIISPEDETDNVYGANVKWRGGTTNVDGKNKRNYNIKFAEDVKLFGMRSDNNWMLDAGQPDVFRLRNRIAMDIWNDMASKPYYIEEEPKALNGVRGRVVEVFLNEEYRGIYNLSEKMDRKQLKLKKVDKTGKVHGVLYKGISFNNTSMNDSIYKYDNYSETLMGYEVKYPEPGDDNDSTDWKPLVDAINRILILCYDDEEFEAQVEEWFDIPVMIDYSIFLSSVNALDNSGKNMYWAVYDKATTKRLTLAPWDLDCTFGQRWGGRLVTEENNHTSPDYFSDVVIAVFYNFYRTNALQFNNQLNERYQELRQTGNVLSTESLINRFTKYYHAVKHSGAAAREEAKWSGDSDVWGDIIDFDKEYEYICNWIEQHMDAVDKQGFPVYFFNKNNTNIVVKRIADESNYSVYTLSGQRINNPKQLQRGIYIVNGKKVVY